jgi:predicted nucleic acid-binding protein
MARQTLVLDASVGVKWFSDKGEAALRQSLAIRDAHMSQQALIVVPDLFYYEVANAVARKKFIPTDTVQSAVAALFALGLRTAPIDADLLANSVDLSREFSITVYDSCYMSIARQYNCPLVTANPRHQGRDFGCQVIPIEEWRVEA